MSGDNDVRISLPADVNEIDDTGYVWAFVDTATEPARVEPGAIIVAGDDHEPFLARVVDVVDGPGGRSIVYLDVVGIPSEVIDELRHSRLIA
jgi:hypothetical protein